VEDVLVIYQKTIPLDIKAVSVYHGVDIDIVI